MDINQFLKELKFQFEVLNTDIVDLTIFNACEIFTCMDPDEIDISDITCLYY